ncbi:MAG: potassium-transporting ATPase subunit KdpC [Syntrophales bacterium]|jgi:K+-transporting ATPase ATPase C chain|nr:potassium-transporting ATPase subunit KdpC [Syntrophales bacterium]
MGKTIRTALLLFFVTTLLTGIVYPLAVTGLGQVLFPRQANGSLISTGEGKTVSELIGQPFSDPRYFWGRPSATMPLAYNGASSAGSNLGPSNPALKEAAGKRIAALRSTDPGNLLPVPVDLVTASGSGLDPHISPAAAFYQVPRVARARGIDEGRVTELVRMQIRDRQFGIFGEPTVNVLRLNMALDSVPPSKSEQSR